MKTVDSISQLGQKGVVLSIGNFDGVHIGHQKILKIAEQTAGKEKTILVVMTFEPHPVMVLQPHTGLGVLTPMELKKEMLAKCGVDCLVVLPCDAGILSLSARDFVSRFLVDSIKPAVVVEGENFHFGSARTGNVDSLRQFGAEAGFKVIVVEPEDVELSRSKTRCSSTLIRNLLQAANVSDAAVALGRLYRLYGQVVPGRGKGKRLGFPTANIAPAEQIIPAEGVYAGKVAIEQTQAEICRADAKTPAALSIGRSRTYGPDNPLLVEAHILEGKVGGLKGKFLAMDFVKRIRSQKKFESEKKLAGRIAKDCEKIKQILARED